MADHVINNNTSDTCMSTPGATAPGPSSSKPFGSTKAESECAAGVEAPTDTSVGADAWAAEITKKVSETILRHALKQDFLKTFFFVMQATSSTW